MRSFTFLFLLLFPILLIGQQVAVVKYNGGGDWYANPTALPNLVRYCNSTIGTSIDEEVATVTLSEPALYKYPYIHMTGHGNVVWGEDEVTQLRSYLLGGGFLHIDDNYGMQPYLQKEFTKLFPNKELVELPSSHPIFNSHVSFPGGLPKIHEHDGERPQAFGFFEHGRLLLLFTYQSDLGDGWENPEVHNDPPAIRQKALDMGANIIKYVFLQS